MGRFLLAGLLVAVWAGGGCRRNQPPLETVLTLDFLHPTNGQVLGFADDVSPGTPGLQYNVMLQVADSSGKAVTLASAKLELQQASSQTWSTGPAAQISGQSILFPGVTLPDGSVALRATVQEQGTTRTAVANVTVSVQTGRPTVTSVTFQNDANGDRCLNATELPSGAPVAVVATTGLEDGQPAVVKDASSGTVYGQGTSSGGKASVALSSLPLTSTTETDFALVVEVTDLSGRTNQLGAGTPSDPQNTAAFVALRVDRVPPTITVTTPATNPVSLALTDDADTSTPGFQFRLAFTTDADVLANAVQIVQNPGTSTLASPSGGAVTQDFTLSATGNAYTFSITATDKCGNVGPTQTINATMPAFVVGARATGGDGDFTDFIPARSLAFVSSSNVNLFPGPNHPGFIVDKVPGGNADADLAFTINNANGASAVALYNGSPLASPQVITSNSQGVSFPGVSLAQASTGQVGVRVFTAGGAEALYTVDATVDVQPPQQTASAPVLVNTAPFSDRAPALNLSWTASGDDGLVGTPAGYDVRWTTDAVIGAGPVTDALYFDATKFKKASASLLPPAATSFQLTGLPTIGTYYVQVRAVDKAGNYAPLSASGTLDHQLNLVTITNPGTTGRFGFIIRSNGDLSGDGIDDLVIESSVGSHLVWIAYGNTNMSTFAASPAQVPIPASSLATNIYDFSIGNAVDPGAAPHIQDLLIADPTWDSNRGRYLLYAGQAGGINPTPVEFRGLGANSNNGTGSGTPSDVGYVKILPDMGSPGGGPPDGIDEILISAAGENGNNGNVYFFYGRSLSAWQALQTANDGPGLDPGINYIPVSAADRIFSGEAPPTCTTCASPPSPSGSFFGVRHGYASLGDITGDGIPDFVIPDSRDFVNKLYVFSGARVNSGGPNATLPQISPLDALQKLQPSSQPAGANGSWRGLGSDAVGNVNIVGGAGKDLVAGQPITNSVYIYADGSASGFTGSPVIITGTGSFGNSLAIGDLNGDGRPDLVVGTNNGAVVSYGWVLYNTGVAGAEFDAQEHGFNQSRLVKDPADSTASVTLGIGVAVGDFNHDGVPDIAVADHLAGPAATPGRIYVRY